jgi:lysophospholipase L1-like esterase
MIGVHLTFSPSGDRISMLKATRVFFSLRVLCVVFILCGTTPAASLAATVAATPVGWVGAWASAQVLAEADKALPSAARRDVTLRQIVRLSLGGSAVRIRVSNAHGTEPLRLTALHVARPLSLPSSRIDPASDRAVTFDGRTDVLIPAGAELTSDAVAVSVESLTSLAITMQIQSVPIHQTTHIASHTTSYVATNENPSASELKSAAAVDHWYFLSAIDVLAPEGLAIVALGDSITDGSGSTKNANNRWVDVLAERLQGSPAHRRISVLNLGIGGNCLVRECNGPNALARFDRDVLARSAVRYLIVLEGINDLGTLTRNGAVPDSQHQDLVRQMIQAYREIAQRARTHGIKVIAGTLLPFRGFEVYRPDDANERDRQLINAWIRAPGNFDAVIDFDKLASDPERSDWLLPEYDSGDHIHPSPAGYRAMGDAIALELFQR